MTKSETVVKLHGRRCRCKELDECTIIMIKENPLVCDISMITISTRVSDVGFGMKRTTKSMACTMFSSKRTCSDSVSLTILEQVHVQVN